MITITHYIPPLVVHDYEVFRTMAEDAVFRSFVKPPEKRLRWAGATMRMFLLIKIDGVHYIIKHNALLAHVDDGKTTIEKKHNLEGRKITIRTLDQYLITYWQYDVQKARYEDASETLRGKIKPEEHRSMQSLFVDYLCKQNDKASVKAFTLVMANTQHLFETLLREGWIEGELELPTIQTEGYC